MFNKRLKVRGVVKELQQWREGYGGMRKVIQFRLHTKDEYQDKYPIISVQMEGRKLKGMVHSGEEVIVKGKLNRMNILIAKRIQVLATGEVVTA